MKHMHAVPTLTVIPAILLCLPFQPPAAGETLDHSTDPGDGRAEFPVGPRRTDAFREDWRSPAARAGSDHSAVKVVA